MLELLTLTTTTHNRRILLAGKERGTSFALPPKHAPKSLQQASRGLPPYATAPLTIVDHAVLMDSRCPVCVLSPNFAKKNQRSRSLSQAYNMSPVQKEQLLQYQKQRKVQNSAATSPGGSIKRKGLKEAVPEQQVMNPLYLLFSPLSSTSPTRSGPTLPLPRRYLPTHTTTRTAPAHRTLMQTTAGDTARCQGDRSTPATGWCRRSVWSPGAS
jgi:hypothetical protein